MARVWELLTTAYDAFIRWVFVPGFTFLILYLIYEASRNRGEVTDDAWRTAARAVLLCTGVALFFTVCEVGAGRWQDVSGLPGWSGFELRTFLLGWVGITVPALAGVGHGLYRQRHSTEGKEADGMTQWHPGKLALLWAGVVLFVLVLLAGKPAPCNASALLLGGWSALPLSRATWRWFSARETDDSEANKFSKGWRIAGRATWGLGMLLLLAAYGFCDTGPSF